MKKYKKKNLIILFLVEIDEKYQKEDKQTLILKCKFFVNIVL